MIHLIENIKISQPAHRALKSAGIETLDQLTQYTEKDLLALHGFGPKGLGILKKWNSASEDWHTIAAENDLRADGMFLSRMKAKDGNFGFVDRISRTKLLKCKSMSYENVCQGY